LLLSGTDAAHAIVAARELARFVAISGSRHGIDGYRRQGG
jgi:hypothetical protein